MSSQAEKRAVFLLVLSAMLFLLLAGTLCWEAVGADPGNPRANFWRVVRDGISGFTKVSSSGHDILITAGENWREFRNSFIMPFAQWVLLLALAGLALVYGFIGTERLERPRSGVRIERFTFGERLLHWYTALMFIIMAVTGLSLLLGRIALIPLFGHRIVSGYLEAAKALHNTCGPLLIVGMIWEILIWFRYNIPTRNDLLWFKNMGGMVGKGPRAPSGKINGGEKAWFWAIIIFGTLVGVTGVLLDFPIWGQSRFTMQVSHAIHAFAAVLFITVSFGHIYMGTLGVEGAFEGMWKGSVDAIWAEEQHAQWYEEVKAETNTD